MFSMLLAAAMPLAVGQVDKTPVFSRADLDFFEAKVRPLLARHCLGCHGDKKQRGGLRLDSREHVLKGGASGIAVVEGDALKSRLFKAVRGPDPRQEAEIEPMPPRGKLSAKEIAILETWIQRGLPYTPGQDPKEAGKGINLEEGRKFWSFQAPCASAPPPTRDKTWAKKPIDGFLLAELEQRGLKPAAPASPRVMIRRAYFDLIGLPPSPEEVESFVQDKRPNAYGQLVDRLLASPHYGERWARHWLDLVRYCDVGEDFYPRQSSPHLYRDWVVRAINDDLPYDQFTQRQLAADLLPNHQPGDLAALGFLGLSPLYWKELKLDHVVIKTVVAEEWEERIHSITSTFLGLTVGCARCHDHKFDPISTQDYYALAGVLASTRLVDRLLLPADQAREVEKARARVKNLEGRLTKLQDKKAGKPEPQAIEELKAEIAALKKTTPHYDAPLAAALDEASLHVLPDGPHATKLVEKPGQAQDVALQIRGNAGSLGPVVPRRFLAVLSPAQPRPFTQGSGRLELARALINEGGPLAARVFVNRVWRHHFGAGLVETPSDFGMQGERPSHPALLDDLAARFIQNGWSLKWLHKEIMLSAAYQQSSTTTAGLDRPALGRDPTNRLLWKMNRRRLDVESWRDAMLAVSGTLDKKTGGPSQDLGDLKNHRRTLYGTVKRREINDLLRLHDFPDPVTHSPNRLPTTTPLQQLYTLNSPFVQHQAAALANRLQSLATDDAARIQRAYMLLFGRPATPAQVRLGVDYLRGGNWDQYAQVLLASNEFLFVD